MANKQKVAIIYIDFDDTLYCHKIHWCFEDDFEYNVMFGLGKLQFEDQYLNYELISKLRSIKDDNDAKGIKTVICLLTGCRTSVFFDAKRHFIKRMTDNLFDNFFSVTTQEEKLPMVQKYNNFLEETEDVEIIDTLMIDDSFYVCSIMMDNGYDSATPGFFEKHYEVEYYEQD